MKIDFDNRDDELPGVGIPRTTGIILGLLLVDAIVGLVVIGDNLGQKNQDNHVLWDETLFAEVRSTV